MVIIVALISTEIFVRLIGNDKLVIKMPDGVPPAVARSFAALLPAMIVISLFGLIAAIFAAFGITDIIEFAGEKTHYFNGGMIARTRTIRM